ncbi:polyamine-modulated factor 1 [Clupea harengus]|uniref:Polyamine-modulated factor 1 n=1 Tax=Clupea harengus TaxID=7950 RepID=A0A6P8GYT4_CLUHA|nr:polyamine-modulated factor 1 [Clupea harengus]
MISFKIGDSSVNMDEDVVEHRQPTDNTANQGSVNDDVSANTTDKCTSSAPQAKRLTLFNKVMEKSLQRLVADASFHRFAHSFHPFYKQNPNMTKAIHQEFVASLQKNIQDDINRVVEEGELQCKLDELDRLCVLAKDKTQAAWRPSGVPEQDVGSFLTPYYTKQDRYMRRELEKLRKENAALAERVREGRSAIANTEQRITAAVDGWKASVEDLGACISTLCPDETFEGL